MVIEQYSLAESLPHQVFHGHTWHSRLLPSIHMFAYPYRYWGVNITALSREQALPEVSIVQPNQSKWLKKIPFKTLLAKGLPLFSAERAALQQFCPDDYLNQSDDAAAGDEQQSPKNTSQSKNEVPKNLESLTLVQALEHRLKEAFIEQTESLPSGDILGLVVCRNAGMYFSPVNFYIGFDNHQTPTHLLAEVSNTPWNKRHYYGFLLDGVETNFCHNKDFHVSPFNPIDQLYRWHVKVTKNSNDKSLHIRIAINISDERGDVLKTGVKMTGMPMTAKSIRHSLKQNPLMNVSSLVRIYWHAFKLYALKKVPYVQYDETLAKSEQRKR